MFDNLWVEHFRPQTLDDLILSDRNRRYFEQIRKKQEIPHLLFSGSPGIGKSTLAKILVTDVLDCQYLYINASDESGVDTIRTKVTEFAQTKSFDGKIKVIILDELDGLSAVRGGKSGTSAQQALRNVIEKYANTTRFIGTCNYRSLVSEALDSRFQEFDLTPPLEAVVERAIKVLKDKNVTVPDENKDKFLELIKHNYPDIRKVIGELHKNTIDNVLMLDYDQNKMDFAKKVFDKLVNKEDFIKIRQFIIQNEVEFSNNYHTLLKNLFDVAYESNLGFDKKRVVMLQIASAMGQHVDVLDKEINAYSCILELVAVI